MGTLRQGYNDLLSWCMNNGARGQLLIDEWYQDKNYNEYGMPNSDVEWEVCNDVIIYRISCSKHIHQIYKVIEYILKSLGHSILEIDFDKAVEKAGEVMFDEVENNLTKTYPQLCKEWDYENNQNMKPEYFTAGSRKEIGWKCCKCGKLWRVYIKSRTAFKTGCSYCGYNVFDGKIHYSARNRKQKPIIPGEFSL